MPRVLLHLIDQSKSARWIVVGILVLVSVLGSNASADASPSLGYRTTDSSALMFVYEYKSHDVAVLNKNGQVIRRIGATGYVQTDREGDLYVADPFGSSAVRIYAPPYTGKPTLIAAGRNQQIINVAVDHKTDIVVVSSQANDTHGGPTELRFYRHGQTTPCRYVAPQQNLPDISFFAFAGDDTLYMIGDTGGAVVPASTGGGCSEAPTRVYRFGNTIAPFGYMAIDANDHFLVQTFEHNKDAAIYTYALPVSGVLRPLSKTVLPDHAGFLSMDSTGAYLWGALGGSILLYNYPAGGPAITRINGLNYPVAMAVFPNYIPADH